MTNTIIDILVHNVCGANLTPQTLCTLEKWLQSKTKKKNKEKNYKISP